MYHFLIASQNRVYFRLEMKLLSELYFDN